MRTHSLRLALVAAALAATGLAAQATPAAAPTQEAPAPARQGRGGADMLKDLNLTADQKTKVEALMQEQRAQRDGQQGPPSEADRQAMQTRRAEMETKLKDIFTPEQFTN